MRLLYSTRGSIIYGRRILSRRLSRQIWISRQWLSSVTGGEEEGGKDEVVSSPRIPPLTGRVVGMTPFDTHIVYKQFQEAGFSSQQAEGIVGVLAGVVRANTQQLAEYQVTHKDLDLLDLKLKGQIDSLRSEHIMLEKATIAQLRNENEMLKSQIGKLKDILKEEIVRVQGSVQLDINLEKSRSKEMDTIRHQSIRDTNSRIGTEVALLRTLIESQKLELVKYLAGGIISLVTVALSVVLGLWRLLK